MTIVCYDRGAQNAKVLLLPPFEDLLDREYLIDAKKKKNLLFVINQLEYSFFFFI